MMMPLGVYSRDPDEASAPAVSLSVNVVAADTKRAPEHSTLEYVWKKKSYITAGNGGTGVVLSPNAVAVENSNTATLTLGDNDEGEYSCEIVNHRNNTVSETLVLPNPILVRAKPDQATSGLKGKICFPKRVTHNGETLEIRATLTTSIDQQGESDAHGPLENNEDIIAVFFEGSNDNTAVIDTISAHTFNFDLQYDEINQRQPVSNLRYVDLPNSIVTIGNYAFYGCSSLRLDTLPIHLSYLGESAFNSAFSAAHPVDLIIPASVVNSSVTNFNEYYGIIYIFALKMK